MLNAATVIPTGAAGMTFNGNAAFNDDVERVTVQMTFSTTFTADLELYVISPDGTVSELIDDVGGGSDFNGTWTFETQAFRGERAAGNWQVRVVDDSAGDTLTVSDIVVRTFGRASSADRYVFTDEYAVYGGIAGHNSITDTNGGTDALNASAVTSSSIIDLQAGAASAIAGKAMTIAVGTVIENAYGGDGDDTLLGNAANNRLVGDRGKDNLDGRLGDDTMLGGRGSDTYKVHDAGDVVNEAAYGGNGQDLVKSLISFSLDNATAVLGAVERLLLLGGKNIDADGNNLDNNITGNTGKNVLFGASGDDNLHGGGGNDVLRGGTGRDLLLGGGGKDAFDFNSLNTSHVTAGGRDLIEDFSHGQDRIDLEGIDAKTGGGNQAFHFIGNHGFTHEKGELRYKFVGPDTLVLADVDGDGSADFAIALHGHKNLVANDFVL
jgi:Ca2+-binding RTX toxin-like protein